MDIIRGHIYSEEDFEYIQKNFNGKAEFDNGSIFLSSNTSINHNRIKRKILSKLDNIVEQSGKIIQYAMVDNQYVIADVYKNDDEYVSTVFNDLKISLKEIY